MEVGIIVAAVGVLLAYRWFNRSFTYMVHEIVELTREAERFQKEEHHE
jgi:hypothetical protein